MGSNSSSSVVGPLTKPWTAKRSTTESKTFIPLARVVISFKTLRLTSFMTEQDISFMLRGFVIPAMSAEFPLRRRFLFCCCYWCWLRIFSRKLWQKLDWTSIGKRNFLSKFKMSNTSFIIKMKLGKVLLRFGFALFEKSCERACP